MNKQTSDEYTENQKVLADRLMECDCGPDRVDSLIRVLFYLGSMMSDDPALEKAILAELEDGKTKCKTFVKHIAEGNNF